MIWQSIDIRTFTEEDYHAAFLMLDEQKHARVEKIRQRKDKMRTVFGDFLARKLLSEQLGCPADALCFSYGEYGKPYLKDNALYFNIAHSEDIVAVAVDQSPIGIDVERIRDIAPRIAKKYFCPNERAYLFGHEARDTDFESILTPDARMRFFELWTAKEAYLKCIGSGMLHVKNVDTTKMSFERHLLFDDYLVTIYR
jgi:4'-phosphopantetheinyl transferase